MTSIVAILRLLIDDSPPFSLGKVSNLLGIASAALTYIPGNTIIAGALWP
jgi:hypothetical protein